MKSPPWTARVWDVTDLGRWLILIHLEIYRTGSESPGDRSSQARFGVGQNGKSGRSGCGVLKLARRETDNRVKRQNRNSNSQPPAAAETGDPNRCATGSGWD